MNLSDLSELSSETNIITHGDGDGVISGAVSRKSGANGNIIVTQPFLLAKQPDLTAPTIITDIALDNRNPQAVLDWLDRNKKNVVALIDHHVGGYQIKDVLGDKYFCDTDAPSCPEFMSKLGFNVPNEWIAAANASDRPNDFKPTTLSKRYNHAFKPALVALQNGDRAAVEAVQQAFIEELISGKESSLVSEYGNKYPILMDNTKKASENYKELFDGVVHTKSENQSDIDMTALLMEGYKKGKVAVVQVKSTDNNYDITVVATSDKELNLVTKFSLGSGAPFRIVLSEGNHDEQLKKVKEVLK